MNKAQQEVMKLAEDKGFPHAKEDVFFLLSRIKTELKEAEIELNTLMYDNFAEELTDVLIQTLQLFGALGLDAEKEFRKKMDKNWKRTWQN